MLQPLEVENKGSRISIMCRQVPGQEKAWIGVVDGLLKQASVTDQSLHLCRRYVLKNGKMVFGWHIGVEAKTAKTLRKSVEAVCEFLESQEPQSGTIPPPPAPELRKTDASDAVKDPNFANDMEVRRAAAQARTTASPRPQEAIPITIPEDAPKPALVKVARGVEEMPLPFVYTNDMNRPTTKGKGASNYGSFTVGRKQ